MDKEINQLIEVLKGRRPFIASSEINYLKRYFMKTNISTGFYDVSPIVYEKVDKNLILSALNSRNSKVKELAKILVFSNPLAFASVDEIKKFLEQKKKEGLEYIEIEDEYTSRDLEEKLGLESQEIERLIEVTGDVGNYLTAETIKGLGLNNKSVANLIRKTNDIEKYLKPEIIYGYMTFYAYEDSWDEEYISDLIIETGNIERYLKSEVLNAFGLYDDSVIKLMIATGDVEKYLDIESLKSFGFDKDPNSITKLIIATGNVDKYLTQEEIRKFGLDIYCVKRLVLNAKDIEKYLTSEKIKKLDLYSDEVIMLIEKTGNIGKYLTPEIIEAGDLDSEQVMELIKKTGNIEKYLTPEIIIAGELRINQLEELIKETGDIEKYLTPEIIKAFGLNGNNILRLMGLEEEGLAQLIDEELNNNTYSYQKILRINEIITNLKESNSGRLARVATEVAGQIYVLPIDEQQKRIEEIKNIYETTNLPTFAQNFLVFKQLHPNFMGDSNKTLYNDSSQGNVPSLERATPSERNHIIFTDLLRIDIESNSRNLRDYLYTIEQGDKLFNLFKEGKVQIDDKLPEESRQILKKYSDMLNTLYNQTSKGRRLESPRANSGDLAQDLNELDNLFQSDTNIKMSLPDRIVRMFGYWAGIRDFEQVKRMIEETTKEADSRNRECAKKGDFTVKKGDFAKGIEYTEFFSLMLQKGIVAKDYLGQASTSDSTPLDMDIELITEDGKLKTAPIYTNGDVSGRKLGKIILIIKNDGNYVKTRDGQDVDEDAIKAIIHDKSKKEYFDNNGVGGTNAHGIRTGIGSTNISYIIADRYVDKLGLEIAMNGFYIPVVNEREKLLFTPEMYDEIKSKMQGLSHYGLTEFKLDKTAKNEGTKQITELIDKNKEVIDYKRKMIFQTLRGAIEKCGLTMSDKRELDLLQGIVEVIDTGSTGRGTNEPGDGDFDFVIRLDSSILKKPEQFKEELKNALYAVSEPAEGDTTAKGDFRYKGVSIKGIKDKVDLDLTFIRRTDEIEYTTEECIKDRLETIQRNNPEDYKYVVANILLAKKVLKTEGAYKKKNAPTPEVGKKDIRGGLGAVGIENWILQNGGSFEKAARNFLEVSRTCQSLNEFQEKYAIWDFGENHMAGEYYPHDNFVYNMNEEGYLKMQKALEDYVKATSIEHSKNSEQNTGKKSLEELVEEDTSVLNNTIYMLSVKSLLSKALQGQLTAR